MIRHWQERDGRSFLFSVWETRADVCLLFWKFLKFESHLMSSNPVFEESRVRRQAVMSIIAIEACKLALSNWRWGRIAFIKTATLPNWCSQKCHHRSHHRRKGNQHCKRFLKWNTYLVSCWGVECLLQLLGQLLRTLVDRMNQTSATLNHTYWRLARIMSYGVHSKSW